MVPPTEPCALSSTQPQKMSTRDFSWGKGGRCVWLTTYHPCSAETSRKSGGLKLPGTPWATSACRGTTLLYFTTKVIILGNIVTDPNNARNNIRWPVAVSGRSCDRPPRHRFFLVSLCLQTNAAMVPQFPSCYYMPLM